MRLLAFPQWKKSRPSCRTWRGNPSPTTHSGTGNNRKIVKAHKAEGREVDWVKSKPEGGHKTAFVYEGHLSPVAVADGCFNAFVPFRQLLLSDKHRRPVCPEIRL